MIELKTYLRIGEVKAVRITKTNFDEIRETLDVGDGCLDPFCDSRENFYGDWYIVDGDSSGGEVMPDSTFRQIFVKK